VGTSEKRTVSEGLASTFGVVVRPLQEFFRLEAASGVVLLVAAVAALVWANSPVGDSYRAFFGSTLTIGAGGKVVEFTIHQMINDGLMAVFFFLVGMEIKRELAVGELKTLRQAVLPGIAALGGMVFPSAIFLAFNWGRPGQPGWGIPMATDIAFAIGCVTLLGRRVSHPLKVFLTAIAIFDDIGGILVIAFFYGHGLQVRWLLGAALVTAVLFAMNRAYVRKGLAYAAAGAALWYALHAGGIHATIAGVIVGLMIPVRPRRDARTLLRELNAHTANLVESSADGVHDAAILQIEETLEDLEPPLTRFVHGLHPYVAFIIMPVFALANSGVSLAGIGLADLVAPLTMGAALGLLIGKPIGIVAFTGLAVRAGLSDRPGNATWAQIVGIGILAGIGFTVALFIAALAYPADPALLDQAKLGVLLASTVAGIGGVIVLRFPPGSSGQG
jgi:Na+:H+ antiporter, NhaA family